jgi:hypothetical protein
MTKRHYQGNYSRKFDRSPKAVVRLIKRKKELETWLRYRYGHTIPEDDDGAVEDMLLLMTFSARTSPDPLAIALNVAEYRAPWMSDQKRQELAWEAVKSRTYPVIWTKY